MWDGEGSRLRGKVWSTEYLPLCQGLSLRSVSAMAGILTVPRYNQGLWPHSCLDAVREEARFGGCGAVKRGRGKGWEGWPRDWVVSANRQVPDACQDPRLLPCSTGSPILRLDKPGTSRDVRRSCGL
jgi:hypothetical protein